MASIRRRCQVCDGPVVNGRCKLCGMPYRNDEELYHMNENRRDHYIHASQRVRREMEEQEVPLPDRNRRTSQNMKVPTSRPYPQMRQAQPRQASPRGGQKQSGSCGTYVLAFLIIIIAIIFGGFMGLLR